MQTITNTRPKNPPFRRYTDAGQPIEVLHRIGKIAIGRRIHPTGGEQPRWVGRWKNRYAQGYTLASILAQLKAYRNEHRAHEAEQISYQDAVEQLLVPVGCLKLFLLAFNLRSDRNYSRKELRRFILSKRGPKTRHYLNCLNQINLN